MQTNHLSYNKAQEYTVQKQLFNMLGVRNTP